MARGRCTFRQTDLTRAIKAAVAAGFPKARAEIEPSGKIVIVFGELDEPVAEQQPPLDAWRAKHGQG
jgi:hypothetical protein